MSTLMPDHASMPKKIDALKEELRDAYAARDAAERRANEFERMLFDIQSKHEELLATHSKARETLDEIRRNLLFHPSTPDSAIVPTVAYCVRFGAQVRSALGMPLEGSRCVEEAKKLVSFRECVAAVAGVSTQLDGTAIIAALFKKFAPPADR